MRLFLPFFVFFLPLIVTALPFVSTWKTTTANEIIVFPNIYTQTNVTIDWGDSNSDSVDANTFASFNHTYVNPGLYNVSIEGQIFWNTSTSATRTKMLDIVSWGDGFLVNQSSVNMFAGYNNLRVSAPPNTQPVFLPGATLSQMFRLTSFNSSLDWDLVNATDLSLMFDSTPLNQPITFRNTQGVTTIYSMFSFANQFNQPFHFDASGLLDASGLFTACTKFNQVVNLTNSSKLISTVSMFFFASSFNQPITFNTDSVTTMASMFIYASNFNQPVDFNVSKVTTMYQMFFGASKFNQPINFQASAKLTNCANMFSNAASFNQPVVMDTSSVTTMSQMFSDATSFASTVCFTSTSKVTDMDSMFASADLFTQDLSSWDTTLVSSCPSFCKWCGLPSLLNCVPCTPRYTNGPLSVCTDGTLPPTSTSTCPSVAPSSAAPSPSSAPTSAPSSSAPSSSAAPSSAAPSSAAPSSADPSVSAAARVSLPLVAALLAMLAAL